MTLGRGGLTGPLSLPHTLQLEDRFGCLPLRLSRALLIDTTLGRALLGSLLHAVILFHPGSGPGRSPASRSPRILAVAPKDRAAEQSGAEFAEAAQAHALQRAEDPTPAVSGIMDCGGRIMELTR